MKKIGISFLLVIVFFSIITCDGYYSKSRRYSGWIIEIKKSNFFGNLFTISDPSDISNRITINVGDYTYKKYNIGDTIR